MYAGPNDNLRAKWRFSWSYTLDSSPEPDMDRRESGLEYLGLPVDDVDTVDLAAIGVETGGEEREAFLDFMALSRLYSTPEERRGWFGVPWPLVPP